MRLKLNLMGTLKVKAPPDGSLDLPNGGTINDVLGALDIPADSVQIVMVNSKPQGDRTHQLVDGDELTILPPVGGG
jgi:sulfur carrier protein ThiS